MYILFLFYFRISINEAYFFSKCKLWYLLKFSNRKKDILRKKMKRGSYVDQIVSQEHSFPLCERYRDKKILAAIVLWEK